MAVKVVAKKGGQALSGKFAEIREGTVSLWSGIMSDQKGGVRGCGKKLGTFPEAEVIIKADDPTREVRRR